MAPPSAAGATSSFTTGDALIATADNATHTMTVTRNGNFVATLAPEKRFFPVQNTTTTEAAIHTNLFADLYAVLGDPGSDQTRDAGGWVIRLYLNPLAPWIWMPPSMSP